MSENRISPIYRFKDKYEKDIELLLTTDPCEIIVTEIEVGSEEFYNKAEGIPQEKIDWFACFAIYYREKGEPGEPANIPYKVVLSDEIVERFKERYKSIFAYYDEEVHEIDFEEVEKTIVFELEVGDPPVGMG